MLRLRPLVRAARCHYDILGVGRRASDEEIKSAFQEMAKARHPDAGKDTSSAAGFRELVDAYRVLRDPKRRRQYDHELRNQEAAAAGGGRDPGFGARPNSGDAGTATVQRNPAEGFLLGGLFIGGAWLLSQQLGNKTASYKDPDPYPRKMPTAGKYAVKPDAALAAGSAELPTRSESRETAMEAVSARTPSVPSNSGNMMGASDGHVMVKSYLDPYSNRWYRLPDGYEPPGSVDLTAWHHKRTDPTEWANLHATGQLSQIMPRGGLQVRFVPKFETFEPYLIGDPVTGKTVLNSKRLPARVPKEQCEVQF